MRVGVVMGLGDYGVDHWRLFLAKDNERKEKQTNYPARQ